MGPIELESMGEMFALHAKASGAIVLTNRFGAEIVRTLRDGAPLSNQSHILAGKFDVSPAEAEAAITEVMASRSTAGVLDAVRHDFLNTPAYRAPRCDPVVTYVHQDRAITLVCESPVLSAQITSVLAPLVRRDEPATEVIEIIEEPNGFGIFGAARPLWGLCSLDEVRHIVIREVLECLTGREHVGQTLHAGAVARNGRTLILTGESGAGKTTLGLGLALAGCAYVADDHVMLDRDGTSVIATPMRASAKVWSWDLPEVAPLLEPDTADMPRMGVRYAMAPNAVPFGTGQPVSGVIFPQYDAAAAGSIAPLDPAEAFLRLIKAGARTTRQLNTIAPLCNLLNNVPCYELIYGSSDFSVPACLDLLES